MVGKESRADYCWRIDGTWVVDLLARQKRNRQMLVLELVLGSHAVRANGRQAHEAVVVVTCARARVSANVQARVGG
jgi:hypothetical protein